jgi:hypothetical protein
VALKEVPAMDYILEATIPNQQVLQIHNDAKSIPSNKPILLLREEGLNTIKVVEAIYKTAK